MHCTRGANRSVGDSVSDVVAAPTTASRTNGMVKTPSRLLPTVNSNAKAVLPPHCCCVDVWRMLHDCTYRGEADASGEGGGHAAKHGQANGELWL